MLSDAVQLMEWARDTCGSLHLVMDRTNAKQELLQADLQNCEGFLSEEKYCAINYRLGPKKLIGSFTSISSP